MIFVDRVDAGQRPASVRGHLRDEPAVGLGLGHDDVVLDLNRQAQDLLHCENRLVAIPGATHLCEEPGTLQPAAETARDGFTGHLATESRPAVRP